MPLTPAQWDMVVHADGPWLLVMRFDERVIKNCEEELDTCRSSYRVERRELFEAGATLREVRSAAGPAARPSGPGCSQLGMLGQRAGLPAMQWSGGRWATDSPGLHQRHARRCPAAWPPCRLLP